MILANLISYVEKSVSREASSRERVIFAYQINE